MTLVFPGRERVLREAIRTGNADLVAARVSKHLAFAFIPRLVGCVTCWHDGVWRTHHPARGVIAEHRSRREADAWAAEHGGWIEWPEQRKIRTEETTECR